jgi:pimeloyl-ACP methyl ester carboxylesterase
MQYLISKLIGFYLNVMALVAPRKAAKAGFELFCYPFRSKLTPRQHEFFQTAQRFTIDLNTEKVQVYRWGTGSKNILLLHGWQSHTYRWKSYVETFDKKSYTIYALDAPGHGLSTGKFMTVPLYSEAVKLLLTQVGKIHAVVAHSLGSFTAIYTFYERPDMAPEKLVSLSSPGEANEFFDFYKTKLGLTERMLNLTIKW